MALSAAPFTIEDLWKIERLGTPHLSPDGALAVCSVTTPSMADNKSTQSLWILSALGGRPRRLTHCGDKDGQARFSPTGDLIGFVARRDQEGRKDETPQFYVIPPDGGEARRVGDVATGVEAFKWFPDGRRVAFVSWVWPELAGAKAQAKRHAEEKDRKSTGYATDQGVYRFWDHFVPHGRVAHLHVMDVATGKVTDLFEGRDLELTRHDPGADAFDISPDGRRIVFAHDPAPIKRADDRFVLAEIEVRSGQLHELAADAEWDHRSARYSPDGERIAFLTSHQGRKHTMPTQLAIWTRATRRWDLLSGEWDHEVQAPLIWEEDGDALMFLAEHQGRNHAWRFDVADRRAERVVEGGWVAGIDKRAGTLVATLDSADHPARVMAWLPGEPPRRLESFNDTLMRRFELGRTQEVWFEGALGDPVQMWLHYPPDFDPKKRWPVLHSIHGGPHTGPGDNWHYRWNCKLFAAQGYVVASVNYHGSSGFGHAFLDSITHRWGELELQDMEAATDWLRRKPWVAKNRIFASGGSYGGYMVAWMNGHVAPGRYAAYVCHAGCFDWTAMFADDAYDWHAKELGGWYWEDFERVNRQSPHAHAGAMRTPTLVIHGALDYRVPDAQGLAYYNTLKALGVPSRLLWFPDENHWILKPQNSRQWHQEFFDWLQAWDPARTTRTSKKAVVRSRQRA